MWVGELQEVTPRIRDSVEIAKKACTLQALPLGAH